MSPLGSFEKVDAEMADAASVESAKGETPAGDEAASGEASSGVEAGAPHVETYGVETAVWWTEAAVEGVLSKSDVIERRVMTGSMEVHESIRQAKQLVDTYNHNLSDIDWAAAIVIRELNMFELAERKRLSLELLLC